MKRYRTIILIVIVLGLMGFLAAATWNSYRSDYRHRIESQTLRPRLVNGQYGYFRGDICVIKPEYDDAREIVEGVAIVKKHDHFGVITPEGRELIAVKFDDIRYPSEGRLFVTLNKKMALFDVSGEQRTDFLFDEALMFTEGLAAAERDGLWGFIDPNGEWALKPQFQYSDPFSEGLAFVYKPDDHGKYVRGVFIDHKGVEKVQTPYAAIDGFHCGRALVLVGGNYNYIDRSGKLAFSTPFLWARSFDESDKVALVRDETGKERIIDLTGHFVN